MADSLAFNMDCMEAMKRFPDKYFDLCIADPPYGISITNRHRSQTVNVERGGQPRSLVEAADRSEAKAKPYGAAKSNLANQNFILCSMTAPHRTQKHSGSYRG